MTISLNAIFALAWLSVTDPRAAARQLMGFGFSRTVLWSGLALTVLCNAIVFSLGNLITPPAGPMPGFMASPFVFAAFLFSGLVVTIFGLHWTGRMFGGSGTLPDIIVLMSWLQVLRLMVQIAMLVLIPILPGLAALAMLATALIGLWIIVHFVDEAHGFGNLFKSFGVILFAIIAVAIGLSIMLTLIGVGAGGIV